MGNVASLKVKAERNLRGTLISRRIQGLELGKKAFFFVSGVIISIPFTIYAKNLTNPLLFDFLKRIFYIRLFSTAIFTPIIEEFAKAYPLLHRQGDTKKSLLPLGFLVGLGFGVNELLIYVLEKGATIHSRLPVIFFHAATTTITAYGIRRNRPFLPYLIAASLHSALNLAALYHLFWLTSGYPIILTTFLIAFHLNTKKSPVSARERQEDSDLLRPPADEGKGMETIVI
jgi:RsiW-degrading membrane proteinase PrsW (M82 family)